MTNGRINKLDEFYVSLAVSLYKLGAGCLSDSRHFSSHSWMASITN